MNYKNYLKKMGLTNNEVIAILQPHFPKFSKIQCAMISAPEKYGVQLTSAAKSKLPKPQAKPRKTPPKQNRLTLCLDDKQYSELAEKAKAAGHDSPLEYLQRMIE